MGLKLRRNLDPANKAATEPRSKFGGSLKPNASPSQFEEDGDLVLKIRQFKNLAMADFTNMKLKLGLFAGNSLVKDRNRNSCILFTELNPTL